ncbi:Crp/Fnr family transcriptional regulator [Spirosoma montaniterrae]|uniref:Crp/Fnr family transcriptional regulator n=1 Tax=Spirosoma montaniterrae TaxID=1178516 RepID=A0A1P9WSG5_9BACT|nr:Crp/Fnr family transcriptional regulator [Spirosoma montaniterrae]AQG78297.1 Crp/Fnr family transcriptional regulator [Spirosoma montaniterrae]
MAPDIQYWYLRDHKLFSTLNNAQIKDLCIITRYKRASRNEIIYFASDPIQRIYLLKKGMIKIVESDPDGREVIKDIIQKGDIFGELSLSGMNGTSEYAQAISSEVLICSFTLADFENVLAQDPTISLKFSKFIGFKFKRLQNRYANLVFKDVRQRIIEFLHEWAEKEGQPQGQTIVVNNYLTHQDIAQLVCTSRQTVTQTLNALEAEGKLTYSRQEIVFPSADFPAFSTQNRSIM